MGFVKEFRDFAVKGNVVDLAVGVIIGASFGLIVTSLINDMIMPLISAMGLNVDFSNLYFPLNSKGADAMHPTPDTTLSLLEIRKVGPVLAYGNFATVALNFVILAFCIFLMVKAVNKARRTTPATPPGPSRSEILLAEIRDAVRKH